MTEVKGVWLFMLATLALNITPGPDMLYVIARRMGQGRAAGVFSSLSVAAGCAFHTLLVACGLAGLLATLPVAYEAIKYAGAAYLIFLGARTVIDCRRTRPDRQMAKDGLGAIFLQGTLTNVLNPKVALFFLAFLPQFVDRAKGHVALQIVTLGVLFNVSGTTVNILVASTASFAGGRLKSWAGESAAFRWLTGCVFIGLGVRLALLERR